MTLHRQATKIASKGRKGDSVLVHMTPKEVAGLQSLALSVNGKPLTVNPKTGLVEANSLKKYIGPLVGAIAGGMGWSTTTASVLGGIANGLANGMTLRNVGLGALSAGTARDMANDINNPKVSVPITPPQGTTPLAPAPSNTSTPKIIGGTDDPITRTASSVPPAATPTVAQTGGNAQKQVAQTPTATPTATPTTPPTVLDRFKTLGKNAATIYNDPKLQKEFVDNHKLQALAMMAAAAATTQRAPKNGGEAPVQRWESQWEPGVYNQDFGKYAGEPYYVPGTRGFKNGHWTTAPYGTVEPTEPASYAANPQAYRFLHPIAAARGGYFAEGGDTATAQDPRLFPFSGNVYDPNTGNPPDPRLTYSSPFTGATYQSAYASDLDSYLNNLNTSLRPRPRPPTTPVEPAVRPTPGDNGVVNGGTPGTGVGGPGVGGGGAGGGRGDGTEPTRPGGGGGYGGGVGIGSLPVLPPPVTPNPPAPPTPPNGGTTPDAGGGSSGPLTDEQRQNMIDNVTAGVPSTRADAAEPASGRGGGGGGFGGGAGGSGPVGGNTGGGGSVPDQINSSPNVMDVAGNVINYANQLVNAPADVRNNLIQRFMNNVLPNSDVPRDIDGTPITDQMSPEEKERVLAAERQRNQIKTAVRVGLNPFSFITHPIKTYQGLKNGDIQGQFYDETLAEQFGLGEFSPEQIAEMYTAGAGLLGRNWQRGLPALQQQEAEIGKKEAEKQREQAAKEAAADRVEQSGAGQRGSGLTTRNSFDVTSPFFQLGGQRTIQGVEDPVTGVRFSAHGGMLGHGYAGGGGIASLGSYSDGGRFLKGPGDGVSDDIPGVIHHPDGNQQPARLATGEFVFPARIVSEIGNGSSDAGAQKLYAIMDRIQNDRKRTIKNVAADTNADRHFNSMMA